MKSSVLYVKNMVCNRCIKVVYEELEKAGYDISSIQLGRVELSNNKDEVDPGKIKAILNKHGFELIDDKKSLLIEATKTLIIKKIHYKDLSSQKIVWSELISNHVYYEYKYISRLFSTIEGITIEQYIILQKIEKVKEMIVYNDLSLSEISWIMGYSSIAHMSSQFKRMTGMTPNGFKEMGIKHRKPLDKV
jgi:AraC-like DNA-binding protein